MGELRCFPSAAGKTRKWADVTCKQAAVAAAPVVRACVCVVERERSEHARLLHISFFNFFEILSSADTMSVLCYNKGCGQRFDPENNPDGE